MLPIAKPCINDSSYTCDFVPLSEPCQIVLYDIDAKGTQRVDFGHNLNVLSSLYFTLTCITVSGNRLCSLVRKETTLLSYLLLQYMVGIIHRSIKTCRRITRSPAVQQCFKAYTYSLMSFLLSVSHGSL